MRRIIVDHETYLFYGNSLINTSDQTRVLSVLLYTVKDSKNLHCGSHFISMTLGKWAILSEVLYGQHKTKQLTI